MENWIIAKNSMMWLKGGGSYLSTSFDASTNFFQLVPESLYSGLSCISSYSTKLTYYSSTVIEHMRDLFTRNGKTVIAYWYFTFTDTEKQSVANVLCSLVRDIYSNRQDTPPELKIAYEDANHGQQRPIVSQLLNLLRVVMRGFEDIFLIFDAVDECRKAGGERGAFLDMLRLIHAWELDQLHVFFSSRAEVDITGAFCSLTGRASFSVIEVQGDQCQRDIEMFLDLRLESRFAKWTPELKAFVRHNIMSRADGM